MRRQEANRKEAAKRLRRLLNSNYQSTSEGKVKLVYKGTNINDESVLKLFIKKW